MAKWKMPPVAKMYEALSAVVDGRVKMVDETHASVSSSDGHKAYEVSWSEDRRVFSSNDNASYWQGYVGYPIVAVLLCLGVIQYDHEVARPLAGVRWKTINDAHKRDYDAAVGVVLAEVDACGGDSASIVEEVGMIYADLERLELERGSRGAPPPKG